MILSDEELAMIMQEYWELYRDMWNDGVITESDYESGFEYWSLEAQAKATTEAIKKWGDEPCKDIQHYSSYWYFTVLGKYVNQKNCFECWEGLGE